MTAVHVSMTRWLSELAGFQSATLLLERPTVAQALASLIDRLDAPATARLVRGGQLHPSVLVVLEGTVCVNPATTSLSDGQTLQLILPTAGG